MESNSITTQAASYATVLRARRSLKVVWIGPVAGGLGWLFERIRQFHSPHTQSIEMSVSSLGSADDLRDIVEAGGDRLVFAVCNRLDYPQEAIGWLSANAPELPISLATDTWWEGSRRTGLGALPHLVMPWHRWWDGWVDWLEASSAEMFGPVVSPMTFGMEVRQRTKAIASTTQAGTPSRGWVVAHCAQTSEAWSLVAQQSGALVERHTAVKILEATEEEHPPLDWLLWDDSCLATCGGSHELFQGVQFIEAARRIFPRTPIYCAYSLPHWSMWEAMLSAGANEILTKPNTGRGLRQLLSKQ